MIFRLVESEEVKKRIPWNKGKRKERPAWIMELNDDGQLHVHYTRKREAAKKEKVGFELTFEEYCKLVQEAGLKSSGLGYKAADGRKIVLARVGDEGPYKYGNCRFTTQKENAQERKVSEKSRENSRRNAAIMNSKKPDNIWELVKQGMADSPYYQEKRRKAEEREAERQANLHPSYAGARNSQAGTYWIHNKETGEAIKWSDKKGPLPDGFERGRKSNK